MTPLTIEKDVALVLIEPEVPEGFRFAEIDNENVAWFESACWNAVRTCPYRVGQEVPVREEYALGDKESCDCLPGACLCRPEVHYRSDWNGIDDDVRWLPAEVMPEWAMRMLPVASISVRDNKYWELRF